MRYMLLIYMDENALDETERQECYAESAGVAQEIDATGHYLDAALLRPTSTATSVKVREGKRLVTDGRFAETREQLAGYFLIEARDLDDAIDIADRVPVARWGTVEVDGDRRPAHPLVAQGGFSESRSVQRSTAPFVATD